MEIDLSLVLDALSAMIWIARPDGRMDFVNRRWSEYTGLSLDEGHCLEWQAAVDPEDLPRLLERWRSILASGEPGETEARVRRSDGRYRRLLVHCNPTRDDAGQIVKWCGVATDVDDLRRAEESLERRELNFQLVVDSIPVPVAVTTPTGEVEVLNRPTRDYFGKTFEELKGWKASDVVHPDDLEYTIAAQKDAHQTGRTYNVESRHLRADGVYRWHNVLGLPLRDPQGNILRWFHLLTDIEDRKRAEVALKASEAYSRQIVDSMPGMVATFTPDGEVERVNRQVLEYFGTPEEEHRRWAANDSVLPEDLPRAIEVFSRSLATGGAFEVEVRARRFDGSYRWLQSRGLPLRDADGRIVRWYNLLTDIDERKRAEEALAASERKLKVMIDTIPAYSWSASAESRTEFVSQHYLDYIGLPAHRAQDWRWAESVHPDDLTGLAAWWQNILASGKSGEAEARVRRFDGAYRWFLIRVKPLRDERGNIVQWYGVDTDIDDLKRADEALRANERQSRLIVNTIPGMVAVFAASGEAEYLNEQFLEYLGQTFEEFANWPTNGTVHPVDLPHHVEALTLSLKSGNPIDFETRLRRFDGVYRWFQLRGHPARDTNGHIVRWYCLMSDVDDRKRAEEAQVESERNLKVIVDTIPALAWSARVDGTAEFFNQHYLDYVGLTAEQAQDWGWTVAVHSEDLTGLATTWQSIMASGKSGEAEARLRRRDGGYRWFLFRVNPLRDEHGVIIKWYGVNTDIEDRKRSEESFRAIVETTPECVKVVARDGMVLRTNAAGAVMAGVPSVNDVVGRRFFDFVAPEHREQYREFHERVCAGQKGFLEFDLVNAQGVRRHMETHAAPLRTSDGSVVQLGVTRDMTARKQAEDALRRSEAFLAEGQYLARMGNLSWNVTSGEIIWSEQLYRIFEFEPGTPITLDLIASRVHPEDMPLLADMVERAERGEGDFEYQHRIVLPSLSIKHLHLIAHRARDRTDQIEYIGAVLDITQRRLSEEALEKLRSELAQVTRIMSLGVLTASIAHEVNQPLSGIVTNASTCLRMLAADPPNIDVAQETARRTIRDGNRAADVIARLRALFSNKTATIEAVDLNEAVREVIALSSSDLQRSRVIVRPELDNGLPFVSGDRIQLQQVIMNLLRNATDAMSSVNDRARRMIVRTECDEEGSVRLSVEDTGVGFGPQGAERLFEAFYTTKSHGMGIGLSLSRTIIENHNGRLWAQANNGSGATFSFSIPACSADETSVPDIGAAVAAGGMQGVTRIS